MVVVFLFLLVVTVVDQSVCLSCTFELPDSISHDSGAHVSGPEQDCSLCLAEFQPVGTGLFLGPIEMSECRYLDAFLHNDPLASLIFHPPRFFLL